MLYVTEPSKLYGPRASVIILRNSDCCIREPDNTSSLSGVLREPRIIHILQLIQDQHRVTTTLQHLVQKYYTSECGRLITLVYNTCSSKTKLEF